jgi:hypothetical protein
MRIPQFGEKIEEDGLTYRWAEPSDAEAFSLWSSTNAKIPHKDVVATMSVNNPTCVYFVIEKNGVPLLFAPFYLQMLLGFLAFNPHAGRRDRINALEKMHEVSAGFASNLGIREVVVQTSPEYPVAKWAVKNGFEEEPRTTFKYRVTPLVDPEVEAHYETVEA